MSEVSASPDGNIPTAAPENEAPPAVPVVHLQVPVEVVPEGAQILPVEVVTGGAGIWPAGSTSPAASDESAGTAAVEWDHSGRVTSSKFASGHVCQYRYDQNGNLYAFTYARLAWSTVDGINWAARDHAYDWVLTGKVAVCLDGTIRIERPDVVRTLKLNDSIVDEYPDGTFIESVRPAFEVMPTDLLAMNHPRAFVHPPQSVADMDTASSQLTVPPGIPPSGKHDEVENDAARRVFAGGRRMNRLRVVEEAAAAHSALGFVQETKASLANFVATSAMRLLEMAKGPDCLQLAPFLDQLATVSHRERRVDEARILHERALQIRRTQHGHDHADTGLNLHGLGKIYFEWGRYAEAEQNLLDAVKVLERGLRKARFMDSAGAVGDAYVTQHLQQLVGALHSLASLYHEQQKLDLCAQLYESAVSACSSVDEHHRMPIRDIIQSLAAMAAQASLAEHSPNRVQTAPSRIRANL